MNSNQFPFVTVNILAYNRKEEVDITLRKILYNLEYPKDRYEVIVVDNASTDGTYEMIKTKYPEVKVIRLEKNIGIAGWNEGFKAGKGDYFLVLDDDSHIETGLIEAINFLENNKNIGILACKIVGGPFTTDHWKDLDDCIGFINCGALIRKDLINKIGGFAEEMFLYSNEWEYSIRALDQGFKIVYFSKCVVIHRASKKNRSIKRLRTLTTRNELWIVWRYYTGFKKFLLMFRVLFWNMMASRHEGVNSVFYALSGLLKFINMEKIKQLELIRRY